MHECNPWLPLNHWYFQVANIFLVFSYVCPNNLKGLFMLRFCLGMSGLFFSLWAWLILCAPDTLTWNIFFFVINFVHMGYVGYTIRPVKFSKEVEEIYKMVFAPIHVPRHQFKLLVSDELIEYGYLKEDVSYAVEEMTEFNVLSLLVSGSMDVYRGKTLLHSIEKGQFIDSPEWFASTENEKIFYRVSVVCSKDCVFISWDMKKLKAFLQKNSYLKSVMDNVIGSDVSKKLFAVDLTSGLQTYNSLLTVCAMRGSLLLDEFLVLRERHDIVHESRPTSSHFHINSSENIHPTFAEEEDHHSENKPILQKETVL